MAARAGLDPSGRFIQPLHLGFAQWLNRHQETLGPVFAGRHTSVARRSEQAAVMIAYVHNDPVRAGLVRDPAESAWTSHAAYLGLVPAPPWLAVERGSRCTASMPVRAAAGPSTTMSSGGRRGGEIRRSRAGTSIAAVDRRGRRLARPSRWAPRVRRSWGTRPSTTCSPGLVACSARDGQDRPSRCCGVSRRSEAWRWTRRSRDRQRRVSEARRLVLRVWSRYLNRPQGEMGAALGLSSSAVSQLLRTAHRPDGDLASDLAQACWALLGDEN